MGATGYLIAGGLLQGAGAAITRSADQRRQEALLALQRAYQVEDRNYGAQQEIAKVKEQGNQRLLEIDATAKGNQATERVKAAADAANIVLKGNVDLAKDTRIEKLRQSGKLTEDAYQSALDTQKELKIAGVTVDHWATDNSGQLVAFSKKGDILKYSTGPQTYPLPKTQDDDPIAAAAAARGGGTGKPAAPAKASPTKEQDTVRKQALARLPGLYMQIQSNPAQYKSQYPGMFDANGNLLPIGVLKDRINQRYGAQ